VSDSTGDGPLSIAFLQAVDPHPPQLQEAWVTSKTFLDVDRQIVCPLDPKPIPRVLALRLVETVQEAMFRLEQSFPYHQAGPA
jgi:hypothetical protein